MVKVPRSLPFVRALGGEYKFSPSVAWQSSFEEGPGSQRLPSSWVYQGLLNQVIGRLRVIGYNRFGYNRGHCAYVD